MDDKNSQLLSLKAEIAKRLSLKDNVLSLRKKSNKVQILISQPNTKIDDATIINLFKDIPIIHVIKEKFNDKIGENFEITYKRKDDTTIIKNTISTIGDSYLVNILLNENSDLQNQLELYKNQAAIIRNGNIEKNYLFNVNIIKKIFDELSDLENIDISKKDEPIDERNSLTTPMDKILHLWANLTGAVNELANNNQLNWFKADYPNLWGKIPERIKENIKAESESIPEKTEKSKYSWKDIVIEIIDNDTLTIKEGIEKAVRVNCSDIGLMNKTKSQPNSQWDLLMLLAEKQGLIPYREWNFKNRKIIEKQISELRKRLKSYFKIDSDPIPFKRTSIKQKIGYQTEFTLRDKRP